MKRCLHDCGVRHETAVEVQHPQVPSKVAGRFGGGQACRSAIPSGSVCEPLPEILYPRNVTSAARKMHFPGLSRIPKACSWVKIVLKIS